MSSTGAYPSWLPDPIFFQGDWDSFVQTLYAVFKQDFVDGSPRYRSRPVWHDRRVAPDDTYGFEEGFWHLITSNQRKRNSTTGKIEKERVPEFQRAARLPWSRPTIDNDTEPEVLSWDYEQDTKKGTVVRTYIWLKDHDFVVILERQTKRKGDIFMLITSFYIDHKAKRRDLESRYKNRKR